RLVDRVLRAASYRADTGIEGLVAWDGGGVRVASRIVAFDPLVLERHRRKAGTPVGVAAPLRLHGRQQRLVGVVAVAVLVLVSQVVSADALERIARAVVEALR